MHRIHRIPELPLLSYDSCGFPNAPFFQTVLLITGVTAIATATNTPVFATSWTSSPSMKVKVAQKAQIGDLRPSGYRGSATPFPFPISFATFPTSERTSSKNLHNQSNGFDVVLHNRRRAASPSLPPFCGGVTDRAQFCRPKAEPIKNTAPSFLPSIHPSAEGGAPKSARAERHAQPRIQSDGGEGRNHRARGEGDCSLYSERLQDIAQDMERN